MLRRRSTVQGEAGGGGEAESWGEGGETGGVGGGGKAVGGGETIGGRNDAASGYLSGKNEGLA